MIFDTQITLRLLSYPIVSGQTTEKLERETTVWAARKSVNRAEYYQAAQAGKKTHSRLPCRVPGPSSLSGSTPRNVSRCWRQGPRRCRAS